MVNVRSCGQSRGILPDLWQYTGMPISPLPAALKDRNEIQSRDVQHFEQAGWHIFLVEEITERVCKEETDEHEAAG